MGHAGRALRQDALEEMAPLDKRASILANYRRYRQKLQRLGLSPEHVRPTLSRDGYLDVEKVEHVRPATTKAAGRASPPGPVQPSCDDPLLREIASLDPEEDAEFRRFVKELKKERSGDSPADPFGKGNDSGRIR